MFGFLKRRRRKRVRARPFPPAWQGILFQNVSLYALLPKTDRLELHRHIHVFLEEKHFEGCGGMELTDEITVTIAVQACLLLLHRDTDYYPSLVTILVYPTAFVTPVVEYSGPGLVTEGEDVLDGETWQEGVVVLSWEDVLADGKNPRKGKNLVIHEFAHQLDMENHDADGVPVLPHADMYAEWAEVLRRAYTRLQSDAAACRSTVLDPYGVTNPAEFFAVATECFFCNPLPLKHCNPSLYRLFVEFYQQDPVELTDTSTE